MASASYVVRLAWEMQLRLFRRPSPDPERVAVQEAAAEAEREAEREGTWIDALVHSGPLQRHYAGRWLARNWGVIAVIGGFIVLALAVSGLSDTLWSLVPVLWMGALIWWLVRRPDHRRLARFAEAHDLGFTYGLRPAPEPTDVFCSTDGTLFEWTMNGLLPGDVRGRLCLCRVGTRPIGGAGRSPERFTAVVTQLPGLAGVAELYCQRRVGHGSIDAAEDVLHRRARMETESVEFDRRYEVFFSPELGRIWMRRLFSPAFLLEMNGAPPGFAFELEGDTLVCFVPGMLGRDRDLKRFCEFSARIVERVRDVTDPLDV